MSLLQRFFLARGGERIASITLRAFGGTSGAPGSAIAVHAGTTASPGAIIQLRPGTSGPEAPNAGLASFDELDDNARVLYFDEYLQAITPRSEIAEEPQPHLLEPEPARTQYDEEEEAEPRYPPEEYIIDGLIAHWTMDNTSGATVSDDVGTYPGQLYNNPIWRPTLGVIGGCLELNGTNQYADFRSELNLIGVPKTYTIWVRPDTIVGQRGIMSKMSNLSATDGDGFLLEQRDAFVAVTVNRPTPQITFDCLAVAVWTFLSVVLEGNQIRLYVDGALVSTGTFTGGTVINFKTGGFLIGRQNNLNRYFDGRLDDARVYDRALSDLDIAELYDEV